MMASKLRDAILTAEEKTEKRKLNLMVLILHHLQSHGYVDTVTRLQTESNLSLKKFTAADNLELLTIIQEYEAYHNIKFGKPPKLIRKTNADDKVEAIVKKRTPPPKYKSSEELPTYNNTGGILNTDKKPKEKSHQRDAPPPIARQSEIMNNHLKLPSISPAPHETKTPETGGTFGVIGTKGISQRESQIRASFTSLDHDTVDESEPMSLYENKLLKPLPAYDTSELRELAAIITRDIYMENPNVRWNDIAGLEESKRLMREAVVYPLQFPELFTGILSPWKGILLYGPPGTGKTMLAKAVATECKTTFFNISASSIVSKWRGDSEKLVRVLFELARYHAPSTIFIDEIEAIMSHRSSDGQEHEGSRRMKTELLIQMDGLAKTNDTVFLLAASNLPWDLDIAMLRRLEKRILIDLPDKEARRSIFESSLPLTATDGNGNAIVGELDYDQLAELSEGYSGSDIKLVCKESAMRPLRRLFSSMDREFQKLQNSSDKSSSPHSSSCVDEAQAKMRIKTAADFYREPISMLDAMESLKCTRPSCSRVQGGKYTEWQTTFGSL